MSDAKKLKSLEAEREIEASLAHRWARQAKAGKQIEGFDLFGPVSAVTGGGVSKRSLLIAA